MNMRDYPTLHLDSK